MNFETSVLSYFGDLDDPLDAKKSTHPFINIVSIAILAVIFGADDWVAVETYGHAKKEWLETFLELSNGILSHDTFGRVFRWLDEATFQLKFAEWTALICEGTSGEVVAMDGKQTNHQTQYLIKHNIGLNLSV